MKKTKKLLLVLVCLALVFTCTSFAASAYENKDFFVADGATLTATDLYTQNGVTGTKLVLSNYTKAQPEIAFADYLDASELAQGISFRLLPATNGQVDVQTVTVIFEDSVDPTQQLAVQVFKGSTWDGQNNAYASVALSDQIKRADFYGYTKVGDSGISALGYNMYWWHGSATGNMYTAKGSRGFGTVNTDYPFFAAEDGNTSTLSLVYDASKTVKVNGKIIARLDAVAEAATPDSASYPEKNIDFFTEALKTASADPEFDELKSRYTQEYVNNLFSSGKVKVRIRVGDTILDKPASIAIQMLSFGKTSLAAPFEFTNNYESVANTSCKSNVWSGEATHVGTKIDIAESCKIELPGTYTRADLANIITYQFLRNGVSDTLPFATSQIILQSASNPDEILTIATAQSNVGGNRLVSSRVAFTDKVDDATYNTNLHNIAGTTQNIIGLEGLSSVKYKGSGDALTSLMGNFAPYYAIVEGKNTHTAPITFALNGNVISHTRRDNLSTYVTTADLANADFLSASTVNLADDGDWQQALKAKYTADYAPNLFSANDVKIYLKFTGVKEAFGINIIKIGGKDAKEMTGFKKVGEITEFVDTIAPSITLGTDKVELNSGDVYTVADFVNYATAKDNVGTPDLAVEVWANGAKIETATFTADKDSEYVIKFSATDGGNNVATKELACEAIEKDLEAETYSTPFEGWYELQTTGEADKVVAVFATINNYNSTRTLDEFGFKLTRESDGFWIFLKADSDKIGEDGKFGIVIYNAGADSYEATPYFIEDGGEMVLAETSVSFVVEDEEIVNETVSNGGSFDLTTVIEDLEDGDVTEEMFIDLATGEQAQVTVSGTTVTFNQIGTIVLDVEKSAKYGIAFNVADDN